MEYGPVYVWFTIYNTYNLSLKTWLPLFLKYVLIMFCLIILNFMVMYTCEYFVKFV